MKREALAGSLLFLLLLAVGPALAASPELNIIQENHDFGQVYQGASVKHTFRFENVGDEPLLIEKVRTSCGCTAALLSDKELAPGEKGELQVTFDSARFRGPVKKTIYLYSNDPLRGVAQMYVQGRVKPEIDQDPMRLDLGSLNPEEEAVFQVKLTNQGEQEIGLSTVQVTAPELRAEPSAEVLAPGESVRLEVRVQPREGRRRINGYVLIETTSVNVPELRIPVYGTVSQ